MTFFEVLEGRELVLLDKENERFVTWNRSITFQVWDSDFEELSIRTASREFKSFEEARKYAALYYDDFINGV